MNEFVSLPDEIEIDGEMCETDGKVLTEEAHSLVEIHRKDDGSFDLDEIKYSLPLAEQDGIIFRVPETTLRDELGHDTHLNPFAPCVGGDFEGDHNAFVDVPNDSFRVLIPDDNGVVWSHQSNGMTMIYPEMKGHLFTLSLSGSDGKVNDLLKQQTVSTNPSQLIPEMNYAQGLLGPYTPDDVEELWSRIDSDILPMEVTDVAAPDGYPQTQEGIRWVRNEGLLDRGRMNGVNAPIPGHDWIEQTEGQKIALLYQNCD